MKNILFLCSANVDRSKTAEDFFASKYSTVEFKSAGTNSKICTKKGSYFITQSLIDWADLILVMELKHQVWIKQNLNAKGKAIIVLEIKDIYNYYQQELIHLLKTKCHAHLHFGLGNKNRLG